MNPEMTTWLLFMWSVAATGLYLFFLAYLPAKALMYRLKLKLSWDTLLAIGTSMLMLVLFIGRFLLPDQILLLIYGLVSLYLAIKYKLIKIGIKKLPSPVLIVILILGVFSQSYSFLNGLVYGFPNLERLVSSLHDQAWHISLVNELLYHYPPQVPGFSGHILSNYHYFYDLLLAGQVKLTGSDTLMLVQIIYPVLVSLFFGISAYQMLGITIKNYYLKLIGLFLIYFGGSFDYILFYLGRQLAYFQPFYLDQPIVFLFNVQTTLSISLVMYALILLSNISQKHKVFIPIMLIWISLIAVKIYAFIIISIIIGLVGLSNGIAYLRKKINFLVLKPYVLLLLTGGIGILLCAFILFRSSNGQFLEWSPGWVGMIFYERVVISLWKNLAGYRAIYVLLDEVTKVYLYDAFMTLLFILVSLNVRFIGLGMIFTKSQKNLNRYLFLLTIIPLLFLSFFRQKFTPFNIIQFGPYATVASTILLLLIIDKIAHRWVQKIIILLILVIALPGTLLFLKNSFNLATKGKLATPLSEFLIKLKPLPYGTILLLSKDGFVKPVATNAVGVLAKKQSYLSDYYQMEVLGIDITARKALVQNLKDGFCQPLPNSITYIVSNKGSISNNCFTQQGYKAYEIDSQNPYELFIKK